MRVLQVIGAMDRGGAETVIMNLYRAMDREHVQFDFLVQTDRECDYDREIRELGGRIFRVPTYGVINGAAYRKAVRAHFAAHPEHRVVHGHIGSSAHIYLDEAKRVGCATVLHSHAQNFEPFLQRQVFHALVKPSLKFADEYLACSPEAGFDRFGEDIVTGSHYHIMANGVDTRLYTCTQEEHIQAKQALGLDGYTVLGHVGRFIEVKNHRFLLQMFKEFLQLVPDSKLLLLGRGPLEDNMKSYASELGISENVLFCGVRDDVPNYLKAMDVFVFPSVLEGLPMATVEAQASGARCLLSTGVPKSAKAAEATKRIKLSEGPQAWAQAAVAALEHGEDSQRENAAAEVKAAGYDIHDTALWLADLYRRLEGVSRQPEGAQ